MSYSETSAFSDNDLLILFQPQNCGTKVGKAVTLLGYIQENFDTGVLETKGKWRGEWSSGTNYTKNDIFSVETNASVYIVLEPHQSTSVANDLTFGRIESMVTGTVIANPQIADGQVTAIKIAGGAVLLSKIQNIANLTVLGNVSGVLAAPQEIPILNEGDMASNSANALAAQQSIKTYFDNNRPIQDNEIKANHIPNGEIPIQKIKTIANFTVIGNTSGDAATPQEIAIVSDDTFATGDANALVRKGSIKAYVDSKASTKIAHFREEQPTGINGDPINASTWTKVSLNTQKFNNISGLSISDDRITIPAGTFKIKASVPVYGVKESFGIRLQNTTDVATTDSGYSAYTPRDGDVDHTGQMRAELFSIFTITSPKTFEIQCFCDSSATLGLSYAGSAIQVYSDVFIEQL